VFAIGEFRALWASEVLSLVGDRLALVALALLIYDRTRSPLLAAVAYAAGYVPYVMGALFLSGVADRLPRRRVMVGCDVIRAVLVTAMVLPHVPLDALIALLYATTAVQPPFDAARSAILRDVLAGERYALGAATMQATFRLAMVGGAVAGGLVAAFIGTRPALAADAGTFVASALFIQCGTRARPAAATASPNAVAQLAGGFRLVFGNFELRTLLMFGWLTAFYAIPVGIAAPYARALGGGSASAGLLIASVQVGAVLVTPLFTRKIGPLTRLRWMGPMALCTCGTLVLTAFHPDLGVSMAIFALSGIFSIYQIAANTAFVERVPNERRAQAFGLANAGLVVGQGLAFMGAGAAVEVLPPSTVIALGGGLGAVIACGLTLSCRRMSPAVGRHSARHLRSQAAHARKAPVRTARSRDRVRAH
jgi:predicted MFS family arabinose efflux permease